MRTLENNGKPLSVNFIGTFSTERDALLSTIKRSRFTETLASGLGLIPGEIDILLSRHDSNTGEVVYARKSAAGIEVWTRV